MTDLITVVLIGHPDSDAAEKLRLGNMGPSQADGFSVRVLDSDVDLAAVLADAPAHLIFTFGKEDSYPVLNAAPLDIRRRWSHFNDLYVEFPELAQRALNGFIDVATKERFPQEPLVSVFTPTWKTGDRIFRTYKSLCDQTYKNWEWVVYDDSPEGDNTWDLLQEIRAGDPRVHVFRSAVPCGVIGEVKRRCCGLARGSILAELDHDDELTANCLSDVVEAFNAHPEAGFVYTDCAEIFENGTNGSYGETYAFGFGSYRPLVYRNHAYAVTNYPEVNAKTVRHIVGMPNHVRAWRTSAYHAAGGYNSEIHVADDYELCIRTFLTTRMVHIQRFGYIQYLGDGGENTQRKRNREIQRLVAAFSWRYEDQIHRRFLELGVDDYIHTGTSLDWDREPTSGNISATIQFP
jgi:glycosyltransferase involved in cell wall biosynthesis